MTTIADTLDRFLAAFNANDLDAVLRFFDDDAEYRPGDGRVHRGRSALREALLPQFTGALGAMRFDEQDRLIDEAAGKAALRWVCRHDIGAAAGAAMPRLLRLVTRLRYGPRLGWYGMDVFHFRDGLIVGKFTYANYGRFPQLRRELGHAGPGPA